MKKLLTLVLLLLTTLSLQAQIMIEGEEYQLVQSDTTRMAVGGSDLSQPTDDVYRVVTNRFWDNWFMFGNVGAHAFFGDYAGIGKFSPSSL